MRKRPRNPKQQWNKDVGRVLAYIIGVVLMFRGIYLAIEYFNF